MANLTPNTKGITEHSKKRMDDSFHRVCLTIERKIKNSELITIKSIADDARVSRTYIYKNAELKGKIESLKETSKVRHSSSLSDAKINARTKSLKNQLQAVSEKYRKTQDDNKALQKENSNLKSYIEELTEKLTEQQQQLRIVR